MMKLIQILLLATVMIPACTPKTGEQTQGSTSQNQGKPAVSDDLCAKFSDSKAGEAALDAHVIYRDYLRREQFKEAIPYWRQAFKAAPGADGQRTTHFDDGVKIYDYLISQQSTASAKKVYLDSVMYVYDRMHACYPEESYVNGKKAFDLYYNYKDLTDNQTIFNHFTNVLDEHGLETPAFVINPFTALLVEMVGKKEVDQDEGLKYAMQILEITEKHAELIESAPCDMNLKFEENAGGDCISIDQNGVKSPSTDVCCELAADIREGWPVVVGYAPQQLESLEEYDFFPCAYFKAKYFDPVNLDSLKCDEFQLLNAQLRKGDCAEDDPVYQAMITEYKERCDTPTGPQACWALMEARKYQDAITCFKEYIGTLEDPATRARYNVYIAKIYYGHLRNFSKAREHARLALRDQPGLGEAYLLIGKLYASSGPLCGPGRGWDSQIVTWPAIDMFQRATQDPATRTEANRLIRDYSRYMPSVEDIFQRQLTEGQSFFVGCWIQESTTIRAAR